MQKNYNFLFLLLMSGLLACTKDQPLTSVDIISNDLAMKEAAAAYVNLFPFEYPQKLPAYLRAIGLQTHAVDDQKVALGRVLFYDKNLSSDRTIACASCHKQSRATAQPSHT